MKTTIEISDGLLNEAREVAEAQATPFHLPKATFSGQGLQPGVSEGDWTVVRELSYEGRGE